MFRDDTKNRYFDTDHPFVTGEQDVRYYNEPVVNIRLNTHMHELIERLAKKRPTWRYKANLDYRLSDNERISKVVVYEGDEALGKLWLESNWRTGASEFHFDNFRLDSKRQRGRSDFSTKSSVAAKRILEAFYPKNPAELLKEAEKATNVIYHAASTARYNYDNKVSAAMALLKEYIVDNWEELRLKIADPTKAAFDLPDLRRKHQELNAVSTLHATDAGLLVMRYGEKYLIKHKPEGAEQPVCEVVSDVPQWAKGKLGMLKLTEPKSVTPEVGSRCSDDVFYIVP